jgi:hypothetical protein
MLEGLQMKPELYYPIHKPPAEFYIVYQRRIGMRRKSDGGVPILVASYLFTPMPN